MVEELFAIIDKNHTISFMKPGIDYIGITVGFICHDGNGNIFLHQRSDNCRDEKGTWDFGGGQLEFGEQSEEALARELREEYGCNGIISARLEPISILRNMEGVNTHWLKIPFIVLVDPEQVRIMELHKVRGSGWFKLGAFPEPFHQGASQLLKANFDEIAYFTMTS